MKQRKPSYDIDTRWPKLSFQILFLFRTLDAADGKNNVAVAVVHQVPDLSPAVVVGLVSPNAALNFGVA